MSNVMWAAQKNKNAVVKLKELGDEHLVIDKHTTNTATVDEAFAIKLTSNGTPADNLGVSQGFYVENDNSEVEEVSRISCVLTDVSNGSEDAELQFWNKIAGTMTKVMTIDSAGTLSSDGDLAWTSAATASFIDNSATALVFGDDAASFLTFDSSTGANRCLFSVDVELADNVGLKLGTGDDIVFKWDGTNLDVTQATANSAILFGVDNAGIDMKWYGDTSGSFMEWDQSADTLTFTDSTPISFGDGLDMTVQFDATNLVINTKVADTGALVLGADDAGVDVILYGATAGSKITWDMSADSLLITDSTPLSFGDGGDVLVQFDATNLKISTAVADTGAVALGASGAGVDLILYGDTATYDVTWDQSADSLIFNDNAKCVFGTGSDVTIAFDGTNLDITGVSDNLEIVIGAAGNAFDLSIFGATAEAISWDASANDLKFEDNCSVHFGTGAGSGAGQAGDVAVQFDGTILSVLATADDALIKLGNGTESFDVWWYADTANDNIILDAGAKTMKLDGIDLTLEDGDFLCFGDSNDFTITGGSSDLLIDGAAADTTIKIGATNNQDIIIYGDTATDLVTFDTSAELCHFDGFDLQLKDDDILLLGDGNDDSIVHDGTDTTWTHITGDLLVDNQLVTGSTIFRLGTDTTAVDFQVQNNSEDPILTVTPTSASGGTVVAEGLCAKSATAAAITAARTLTAADSGGVFSVAKTGAYAITLPTPAQGLSFKFMTLDAGANAVTISNASAHLYGAISINNVSTVLDAETTITLVASADIGDWVEIVGIDATHYMVTGACTTAAKITVA